ncbi:MAG: maltose ABC transporter permease [Spiribacter salinus]|uniref:Maltose ABC transporter permease n=1 Tax=Spiribacter salinus TaxID=1335746 RepID=A0A540VQY4_9GAMM|nr:MAG: maltose ABC transporter permease [Spiribacter salinus]
MRALLDAVGGGFFMFIMVLLALGDLYWLWMSFQIGSFVMFVLGLFPPFFVVTAPVGAWSLVVGTPAWLYDLFG